MRTTAVALIALVACGKNEPKKKDDKPVENQVVAVAPKKVVPTKELPQLTADPGGSTGKPVWQAAFGGYGIDVPKGIAAGSDGSVYITGYFEGETDIGGTKKASAGKSDAFLTKIGADGKVAWAQAFGAARDDVANSVAVKGNKVAIAGSFLDEINVGTFVKKSNGSDDLFIATFDTDGNPDWVWTAGGIDSDGVNTIAATPDGGWVIGGSFIASLAIFVGKNQVDVKSKGGTDALLIKLGPGGDTEWVKTFGGRYNDSIRHLGVDANGNIFVQGVFRDVANWGGSDLKAGGGADDDVVLAKYDTNGDHLWSQRFGNAFDETAGGLAVDPSGYVTITGSFENKGSISFGQGDDHVSLGEADIFVARFDGAGKLAWAKSFGGARIDVGAGIASDSAGNSIVSGWFEGMGDFGKGTMSTKTNNKDVFVLKLDAQGNTVWQQSFGDKDHDQGRAVALDDKGAAYVTGLYRFKLGLVGTPIEQAIDLKDPVLAKAPKPDVFVVKLER